MRLPAVALACMIVFDVFVRKRFQKKIPIFEIANMAGRFVGMRLPRGYP